MRVIFFDGLLKGIGGEIGPVMECDVLAINAWTRIIAMNSFSAERSKRMFFNVFYKTAVFALIALEFQRRMEDPVLL
jgi:hypothetical protein